MLFTNNRAEMAKKQTIYFKKYAEVSSANSQNSAAFHLELGDL